MAKAQGQTSLVFPEYILRDKSRACKQRFKECFQIPGLDYDDWLEQKCAEFNWWTSGLNADEKGPESLDARLKLRPDFMDIISTALDGLESSLSSYYEIGIAKIGSQLPDGKLPDISETMDHSMDSADVERSPSPWSDMSDSSHNYCSSAICDRQENDTQEAYNAATSNHDIYFEPRVYIKTNLEILIRIHTTIKRSSLQFRHQRADEALEQADEAYQRQKAEFGERSAIQGQNGDHERFRRYLTKLVVWNGYTQSLIQRMNFRIAELVETFDAEDKYCCQILLQEKKLLVIFRAYFQDPARLTTVQRRLINANVIRRNRLIYAGSAATPSFQTKEKDKKQSKPKDVVHRPATVHQAKTVLTDSQLQSHLRAPEEPTKGGKKTIESFVVQPATAVDSRFTIAGALAPPSVNRSAATKFSARVEYLDYPKCPVQHGQFPCPYCSIMLTDEYTKKDKWREHVAQDLCAYICVFEDCKYPDDMYASTYEWMSHMAKFHSAVDWVCPECAKHSALSFQDDSVLSFQSSALLKGHILTSHPAFDPVELDLLVETGKRTLEIQRVRCPLCRVGLVTLEDDDDDDDGINGITSLLSMNQEVRLIQLEEDEHIATHIHKFALQSLPYRQEFTLEDVEASLSQSRARSSFQTTLRSPADQQASSTDQPSIYSLNDIAYMLEDLCKNVRWLLSEQWPLKQSPVNIIKLSWIDTARLNHDKSLLNKLLDDLVCRSKMLQRGFGHFRGKDFDALAVSLNECQVTISQHRDLTVDDTIKESLRNQLLYNLDDSNEMLQQAFASTSDELMAQAAEAQTKDAQIEDALIRDVQTKELHFDDIRDKETENEDVHTRSPQTEEAQTTKETEIKERGLLQNKMLETGKFKLEETASTYVEWAETEAEIAVDTEIAAGAEIAAETSPARSPAAMTRNAKPSTAGRSTVTPRAETAVAGGSGNRSDTEESDSESFDSEDSDDKTSSHGKGKDVGVPGSRFTMQKAIRADMGDFVKESGLSSFFPNDSYLDNVAGNAAGDFVNESNLSSFFPDDSYLDKHSKKSIFNMPQDIEEDLSNHIKKARLESFYPEHSDYTRILADNAFNFKNGEENLLNRDVDIQGITRLSLYQSVLYCDDSSSMRVGKRVRSQKNMVRRVTQLSTCVVPSGCGTSLQFINLNSEDVHNDKLSYNDVKKKINSMRPRGNGKIGTNLNKKILTPLIYDVINSGNRLERPIFISCITDGCTSGEPSEKFKKEILKCVQYLNDNGYPRSTVRFQISQIGNDPRADRFLNELRGEILRNPELKEVLYCTAERLNKKFEEFKKNEERLEKWLLQTFLTPLMGEQINTLNFNN